ncbi:MAG: hypothetical protein WCK36_01450 [Candidatus Firestonebacteria bacterium]
MKTGKIFYTVLFFVLLSCLLQAAPPVIPQLTAWENNMKTEGAKYMTQPTCDCTGLASSTYQERFSWYYDGIKVFHQVAKYTKDNSWLTGALNCRNYYRDGYVVGCKNYAVDGWRNFTHGLYYDWIVLNDATSKSTAIKMAKQGKFSQLGVVDWNIYKIEDSSREIAYAINAWHVARDLGDPAFTGRDPYIDKGCAVLDSWKTYLSGYPGSTYPTSDSEKYQPFMFGLLAEALIHVSERSDTAQADKDKIQQKIKEVAVLTYDKLYLPTSHAFPINTSAVSSMAPVLNLLIVPLYGWLWNVTGDNYFLNAGDLIWSDGVVYGPAEFFSGKQYSQNYRWSFDYVRWRSTDPATSAPVAGSANELERVKAYPSPANISAGGTAKIIGLTGNCIAEIFDYNGIKVRELKESQQIYSNTGYIEWNGKNDKGEVVPKGIYVYLITSPAGNKRTGKIAILK